MPGIELEELPASGVDVELALERRIVEVLRAARPRKLAAQLAGRAAHRVRKSEAREIASGVANVELDVEIGLLHAARVAPPSVGGHRPVVVGDGELLDAPVGGVRLRDELELADVVVAHGEGVGADVERGPRIGCRRRVHPRRRPRSCVDRCRGRRCDGALKVREETAVGIDRLRRPPSARFLPGRGRADRSASRRRCASRRCAGRETAGPSR